MGGAGRSQLAWRQAEKAEQTIARLLQAGGAGWAAHPPFAQEGAPPLLHLLWRLGVDHVGVIGGDLLVQGIRSVRKKVAMLMNRASLSRHVGPQRSKCAFQPGRTVS